MITQLQKGKNYFYQISLAMLVAMISIAGCTKKDERPKPTPVILDFKATGWVGDVLVIQGDYLGADVASNIVKFGDKVATVTSAVVDASSKGELKVIVPAGTTTGKISVTVNGVTGTSTMDFTINTETVYIAGYVFKNNKTVAGYWKNNTFVSLTDGTMNASANAIAVIGNDVYVAGTEGDPMTTGKKAKYWKNGVATTLSVQNAEVTGMTVVGNDVYIVGSEIGSTLNFVAKYWKNGIATDISDGTRNEYTGNIAVSGSDIYVIRKNSSTYWKNGVIVIVAVSVGAPGGIGTGTNYFVNTVAIDGNDVYIGGGNYDNSPNGGIRPNAIYWKNGVLVKLSKGSIESLVISNGIVHSAGQDSGNFPQYWKNDSMKILEGFGTGGLITVVGSNVYIAGTGDAGNAGSSIYAPKYWKNGVSVNLGDGKDQGKVTGIVVIP